MIMVTDEMPPSPQGMIGVAAPESLGATSTILELYVDDVDAAFQRAVAAGAKPMMPVRNAFFGDRFGWVLDPFGHLWSLATVVEELTPDQINERMAAASKEYNARASDG